MSARLPQGLLALTPGTLRDEDQLSRLLLSVGRCFEAGLPALLIREPITADGPLLEFTRRCLELAERAQDGDAARPWVGVHDRGHVALEAGADGWHLGFRSLPLPAAREWAGDRLAIGFSAHAADEPGDWEMADYLSFGPVRDTPSKAGLLEPTGFEPLEACCAAFAGPVFALGGMQVADATEARQAGAGGLAVLSRVLGSPDPAQATRSFTSAWAATGPDFP